MPALSRNRNAEPVSGDNRTNFCGPNLAETWKMARPRFPQFENGAKAERETAVRIKRAAALKAHDNETIAREREALERSRMLLKLPRDPLALALSPGPPVAAPSRRKPAKPKTARKIAR